MHFHRLGVFGSAHSGQRRSFLFELLFVVTCGLFPFIDQAQEIGRTRHIITTVAGSKPSFNLVSGPALQFRLRQIKGVTIDASGDIFVADTDNNIVAKIAPNGVLVVVAGDGIAGYSGDGGPTTRASLNSPRGIAVDGSGNLYIADWMNHRIRKVNSTGIITTIAGTGQFGFSGDGGPAITAQLNEPLAVAVDGSGNVYVADSQNQRIRKISANGIITTVAGNGTVGYSGDGGPGPSGAIFLPSGLALDSNGSIYFATPAGPQLVDPPATIRKLDSNGILSTLVDNAFFSNAGASSLIIGPVGLVVDSAGTVYFADASQSFVGEIPSAGRYIEFAGTGRPGFSGDGASAKTAELLNPFGVAMDAAGNFYIADSANGRLRKVDSNGVISTIAGAGLLFSGDGGQATSALLSGPVSVTLDYAGNMFIADGNNLRIRKVTPGGQIETVAGNGDIDVKPGPATASGFRLPIGLATDLSGNVYFADRDDFQVLKLTPEGTLSYFYKNDAKPWGVATDASGNVYVSLYYNFRGAPSPTAQVVKISPSGNVTPFAGTGIVGFAGDNGPATSAQLTSPTSICLDAAGNLYIADGQRVRKVSAAGTITTVAGNGAMGFTGDGGLATNASLTASGIAVDGFGNLFIADINQQRVRQVDAYGFIFTVAGNGIAADSGDDGAATSASLRMGLSTEGSATAADANFVGLTVDTAGNLYIPDSGNSRIRRVSPRTLRSRPRR